MLKAKTIAISAITEVGIISFMTNAPRSKERGAGMSKQIRNKFKYDIPIYHRPIISVDEATAYSGIGRTKLYELTTMENCPFVIWVWTRRVIKRKSFVEYLESQYSISPKCQVCDESIRIIGSSQFFQYPLWQKRQGGHRDVGKKSNKSQE